MPKLLPYDRDLPYAYALGLFPAHALLNARPGAARRLLLKSDARGEGVEALAARCEALGIRAEMADHLLQRISRKENCFAALVFDKWQDALAPDAPHIVLHHPSDMGNLGTILRTCLGFGFEDIALIRPAADAFDPRVVRASMGALCALRLQYFDDFEAYRAQHPAHALYPFMLDGAANLRDLPPPQGRYALVFGNEAEGLPPAFAGLGQAVRIAHGARIDSLNLAVAVAIAAYAFSKEGTIDGSHPQSGL
ncbi:MAG: TrmH family RNA methyltransferase [Oscillospiraceae bacterium]|nr:TrmH family RNA methyltransferase [Oscillospiraceae bacterium]